MLKNIKYNKIWLIIAVLTAGLMSCTPNKKIVYLQDFTKDKPNDHLADTTFLGMESSYLLQANDVISVKINHLQLSKMETQPSVSEGEDEIVRSPLQHPYLNGFAIDPGGNVDLPVIGKVAVGGKTVFAAQEIIAAAADKYYSEPNTKVILLNFYVTVLGEVNRPGRFPVYNNQMNVLEALGLAGDAAEYADRESVKILRTRDGKNQLYHVDLTDQMLLASPAFYLQPNDIIMLRPLKRKKLASRGLQNLYAGLSVIVSAGTLTYLILKNN